jgi:hypothetical protein
MIYYVTQHYSWTFIIEADSPEKAIEKAGDEELSGGDLIADGYLNTTVEAGLKWRYPQWNAVPSCVYFWTLWLEYIMSTVADTTRAELEAKHGQVWTTDEMRDEFEAIGFMAPWVLVRRKSDGASGTLEFTHSPRFYFEFVEA